MTTMKRGPFTSNPLLNEERPVRITLESTSEVVQTSLPACVWRGRSEDGTPILALIMIAAQPSGDVVRMDPRMRTALETRIASSAVITIPAERP